MNLKPFAHQQKLLDANPKKWMLNWSVGTGKTPAAIWLADKNKLKTLIICPKYLKLNWLREIERFSDNPKRFTIIHKEEFKKLCQKLPKYDCIICDEIQFFLGIKSQMHKSICWYLKKHQIEYFYGLSGSVYLSSPWNVYCLGKIFGKEWNYVKFREYFFFRLKLGRLQIYRPKSNIEKPIAQIVNSLGNSVKLEYCVDIPDSVYEKEYFKLNKKQQEAIDNLTDITAIQRFTHIHSIENSCLKGDGYVDDRYFDSDKTDRILELIESNPKIAIVCRYNGQIRFLVGKVKYKEIYIINGNTKDKQVVVDNINNSDNSVVFIQSATSTGYNLWSIPLMVFASNSFAYADRVQCEGRIRRINHPEKRTYIDLITENGIDEEIIKCLDKKESFNIEIYAQKSSL